MKVYFCLLFLIIFNEYDAYGVKKRLLINDPDVIIHRLATMENTVTALIATLQQVLAVNQQQENTIQQVLAVNKQQENTIQQL